MCEGERGRGGQVPRFLFRRLASGARDTSPNLNPALVACGITLS